jgi:hypothetical protein
VEVTLRDFRVRPGHLEDWLTGWREGVLPLRRRCGFQLLGAWLDPATDRFVWLLGYDGPDGWDAADARYHALPERRGLDPEPSSFIAEGVITRMVPVPA